MKAWKHYQQVYAALVTQHTDDRTIQEERYDPEIVQNALNYVKEQSPVAVYPAKSFIVAIIYATFLSEAYGENFFDILNDPQLFCGQDPHFVTYDEDPASYTYILAGLKEIPNWRASGWAPKTEEYCFLECTKEGIERVINSL